MDKQALVDSIALLGSNATGLTISDDATMEKGKEYLLEVKRRAKEVEEVFGPAKDAAHTAHKAASDLFNSAMDPVKAAEKLIKAAIGTYQVEINRRAEEERKRLQAEADKEAAATHAANVKKLEAAGVSEEQAAVQAPIVKVKKVKVTAAAEVKGVSTKTTWGAEVTDIKKLCAAVANGTLDPKFIDANMPELNAIARIEKDKMMVPGVKAVSKTSVVGRA